MTLDPTTLDHWITGNHGEPEPVTYEGWWCECGRKIASRFERCPNCGREEKGVVERISEYTGGRR